MLSPSCGGRSSRAFVPEISPARRRNYLGLPCIEAWAVRASDPTPGLPMPRFYFDMVDDGVTTHDNDGVEMPSAKLARRAATAIVTVIAYDRATKNLAPDFAVVIRDASGIIDTVTSALKVEQPPNGG